MPAVRWQSIEAVSNIEARSIDKSWRTWRKQDPGMLVRNEVRINFTTRWSEIIRQAMFLLSHETIQRQLTMCLYSLVMDIESDAHSDHVRLCVHPHEEVVLWKQTGRKLRSTSRSSTWKLANETSKWRWTPNLRTWRNRSHTLHRPSPSLHEECRRYECHMVLTSTTRCVKSDRTPWNRDEGNSMNSIKEWLNCIETRRERSCREPLIGHPHDE